MARVRKYEVPFVAIECRDIDSLAFKSMSKIAQLAYIYIDKYYWQSGRRNPLQISQSRLANLMQIDEKTAQKVLTDLDDYGFIMRVSAGRIYGPTTGRTSCYKLNWHYDDEGNPPSCDWRKQSKQLKQLAKSNGGKKGD